MFRIASLYGIGQRPNINRSPGLNKTIHCLDKYIKEFSETFPNIMKLIEFVVSLVEYSCCWIYVFQDLSNKTVARTTFGRRLYDDPEM